MADLSTRFFGLTLKNPVIAASSSMTGNLDQVLKIAQAGAGAVVLKSLFEEEIYFQLQEEMKTRQSLAADPEYLDYFDYVIKEENLNKYINLIRDARSGLDIPVIASISCISSNEWTLFARKLQDAGADALELNLFIIPSDVERNNEANEHFYFDTVRKVLEVVSIPVTVKISHYFSNLAGMIRELSRTGIAGITLFNRFYTPDIDVDKQELVTADIFSSPDDYLLPLRWTGITSPVVSCPLAATTGIHSAETVVKFLLAGANAVQLASVLYLEGPSVIKKINRELNDWMDAKSYRSIDEFRGKLSIRAQHATVYERVQFMTYFAGKEYNR